MRKQTKIVIATALLALGASFTSMAAAKNGTWVLEEDGWVCYDKDGDVYEEEFCLSYGKEYYVGDDGLLVTSSWVEHENKWYYVGSDGQKTINDWRFVAPEDDDEADEEWFLFDTKGRMVTGKKVYEGKTYYFDEDGVMLTGWVEYNSVNKKAKVAGTNPVMADLVYCDETGARVASDWVKTFVPGTEEDDQADADLFWYYTKAKGGVQTGKNNDIEGKTYLFGTDGKMLEGWVLATTTGTGSNAKTTYSELNNVASATLTGETVYYCGTDDQGYVKKDRWVKTWAPSKWDDADDDNDQYWYWIAKNGEVYAPAVASGSAAIDVAFTDGELAAPFEETAGYNMFWKEIDDEWYAFNEEGQMWSGLVKQGGKMFYFGGEDDGSMKTGDVMIEDEEGYEYKFFFSEGTKKNDIMEGAAVTGNAGGELYINGLLQTTDDKFAAVPVTIGTDNVYFVIDSDGDIRTTKKVYEDENDNVVHNASNTTFADDTKGSRYEGSFTTLVKTK